MAVALSCVLLPRQSVAGVADADTLSAPPVTVIVTASLAGQPVVCAVAVRVNVVLDVRFNVNGSSTVASDSEDAGTQL